MNSRHPNIFCLPTPLFCSEVIDYYIRLLKKNGRRSSLNGFLNCFLVLENGVNRKGQLFLVGSSKCLRLGALCRAWVKLLLMGEPYEGLAPVIVEEIESPSSLVMVQQENSEEPAIIWIVESDEV